MQEHWNPKPQSIDKEVVQKSHRDFMFLAGYKNHLQASLSYLLAALDSEHLALLSKRNLLDLL